MRGLEGFQVGVEVGDLLQLRAGAFASNSARAKDGNQFRAGRDAA